MDSAIDEPLAPFADPWRLVAQEAAILLPPRRIAVSEAAARYRQVHTATYHGPWDNKTAAYMVEPMDCTARPEYEAVVFCGPAQSLKTAALLENKIVHTVTCVPLDTRVVQMDQNAARRFGKNRLERLARECPEYAGRLSKGRHDDNIYDKRFVGGMTLTVVHPTVNNLSSDPIPQVLLTDYDRMPADLDGEGSPFSLARQRTKTFGAKGMTVVETSPGYDQTNPLWQPSTPHEAPPVGGILGLYNMGDRRRWYWRCPQCGHAFEPSFERLHWPEAPTPAKAAKGVVMPCPDCGMPIDQSMKRELNTGGVWLREGEGLTDEGERIGEPLESSIASFWLRGPAAAFQDWGGLVERYLSAMEAYERSGDETLLRATVNTDQAEPYMPAAIAAKVKEGLLTADILRERAEDFPLRQVPEWALFLVAAVDGQGNRFVVQVEAFGPHLERAVIDRFDVVRPPSGEDRLLDPARYLEDWEALTSAVLHRAYPIAGLPGHVMRAKQVVVDSNGPPGYTGQAYDWWRKHRTTQGNRLLLVRGDSRFGIPRAALIFPDSERKDRHAGARGEVPVLQLATNRLKDMVDAGLRRTENGPGRIHLSRHLPKQVFEEYVAELRGEKGWEQIAKRNEALDLSGYCTGAVLHLKADEVKWDAPDRWPVWLRREGNPYIVAVDAPAPDATDETAEADAPAPEPVTVAAPVEDAQARVQRMLARMTGGG